MARVADFLNPTGRKLVIGGGMFVFVFLFVPVIACREGVETGTSTCANLRLCSTDYYDSLAVRLLSGSGSCTATRITTLQVTGISILLAAGCFLIACGIDALYTRYRSQ